MKYIELKENKLVARYDSEINKEFRKYEDSTTTKEVIVGYEVDEDGNQTDIPIYEYRTETVVGAELPANILRVNDEVFFETIKEGYNFYNNKTKKFELKDFRTLDDLKLSKIAQINAKRDSLETGGFEYLGKVFDSDSISVQRLTSASMTAQLALSQGQEFSIVWTCQDNSNVTLSAVEVVGTVPALAQHSAMLHVKASELKEQVKNATTKEEVEVIVWEE